MNKQTFRDLLVWQKGIVLVRSVYALTEFFPREEMYGLSSQMRRAAVSIPSNIAEGKMRGTDNEFRRFLLIAYGSSGELQTQLEIAKGLPRMDKLDYASVERQLEEVMKMTNGRSCAYF